MNRRNFFGMVAIGGSVSRIPNILAVAEEDGERTSPLGWLRNTPLIIAGNWASTAIFRRRVGGYPTWHDAEFDQQQAAEETVRKLRDLGITMVVTHFFTGFGLEAEKEHIELARKLSRILRKYGLRVGLYVGSTIAYETFLLEKPDAKEWFVPDYLGRPVVYDSQTYRKRVYFMHPGYREYIKRVIRLGIEDLKADLIHFDNTSMQAEAAIFQHPMAIEDFREYLKKKYSPSALEKRLGFSDVKYVTPPKYDRPLRVINDPLFQEWTDFRCQQLGAYYAEMKGFIRSLNSSVAFECNPASGISGRNTIWEQGVDYPRLLPNLDVIWTEEGDKAGVTTNGVLVSKIRTYKMASKLRTQVFAYTGGAVGAGLEMGGRLEMAEAMAYNRQCLGMIGPVFSPLGPELAQEVTAYDVPEDQRNYIRFFSQNFDHYRDVDNIADVALLYSYATMGFNNDQPTVSFMLFGQALIQAKIPFDIIFDLHGEELTRYRVLVLADQECLSEEEIKRIRAFVQQGGGLVATEYTSLYTEWRLRRPEFGLKDLLKVNSPRWRGGGIPEEAIKANPTREQVGKGRVAYMPQVEASIKKPSTSKMSSKYWKLPVNWKELITAVQWTAGDDLSLEVKAPTTVTAELMHQRSTGNLIVHLLNYNVAQVSQVTDIEVTVRIPEGRRVQNVMLLTPDGNKRSVLNHVFKDGRDRFVVPRLHVYNLLVVQLRKEGNLPPA
jgi:Beta-galactosidase trimerisation domain